MNAEEKPIITLMFVVTKRSLLQTEEKMVLGVHGKRTTLPLYRQVVLMHYQIVKSFVWNVTKIPAAMVDD